MSQPEKRKRSNAWYLLPIFFGMIGGVIAFLILRRDDSRKARNCIYIGIGMMVIGIIFNILIAVSIPDFNTEFNVNI